VWAKSLAEATFRVPDCVAGQWRESLHAHRRAGQHLGPRLASIAVFHQRQCRLEPWRSRTAVWNEYPYLPPERLRLRRRHGSHRDLRELAAIYLWSSEHRDGDFPFERQ